MQLFSRVEVAIKLGVSTASVSSYVKKGRIKKVGKLFDIDSYVPYIQSKSTKPKRQATICCEYCQQPFAVNSNAGLSKARKFCSSECRQLGYVRTNIWSPEEIDTFKSMLAEMPDLMVSDSWNRIAAINGWKERSFIALQVMRRKHRTPPGEKRKFWTLTEIARILNINLHRPATRWLKEGLNILVIPSHPKFIAVSREDMKKYAARRPKDFYGTPVNLLNQVFGDMKFSKEIFELAFADTRSQCFCIVKLEGGVFDSQGIAARELQLGISSVENNIRREKDVLGHNLVKLDYPKYLAPIGYEKEFNTLAGNILIQVYAELKNIQGYSKLGIHTVAVRQAVNIALVSFRAHFRNISSNINKEKTLDIIAEFWKNKTLDIFKKHQSLKNFNLSRTRISCILKEKCLSIFSVYGEKRDDYFQQFVDYFVSCYSVRYLDECLPWQLRSEKFTTSDMLTLIECMARGYVRNGKRPKAIAVLKAYQFIKNNKPSVEFNPDWAKHSGYSIDQTESESKESLDIIVQGLDSLEIDQNLKSDCKKYIEAFCTSGDSVEARNAIGIDWNRERQILDVLKQAAMPF